MKKILVLLLIGALLVSTCTFADAQNVTKKDLKERKRIEQLIIAAEKSAFKQADLVLNKDANTGSINVLNLSSNEDLVNTFISSKLKKDKIELVSIQNEGISTRASSPYATHVKIEAPRTYLSSQGYVVTSSARWIDKKWKEHCGSVLWSKVGGEDGLGIYFGSESNISISRSSYYTYDENNVAYNTNLYPSALNNSGVFYQAQDTVKIGLQTYHSYSFNSQHLTAWVSFNGPVSTWARTKFVHTWDNTQLNSVDLSAGGIGASFSNSSSCWEGVSDLSCTIQY